jgi:hypothetical protein
MNYFESTKGQPAPDTQQAGTREVRPKPNSPGALLEWIKANKNPSEGGLELQRAIEAGLISEVFDEDTTS